MNLFQLKSHSQINTLVLMVFLALSLPLLNNLVSSNQDNRSKATEEASTSKVSFKIAFKGVKPSYSCISNLNNIRVNIVNISTKTYQSGIKSSVTPIIGETNKDGDQVFLVSNLSLNSTFNKVNTSNYIQIKNSGYLASGMCLNQQKSKIEKTNDCNINVTNSNKTIYDFSDYPLVPGDINQDGVINSSDFSMVKSNLNSLDETSCDKTGDINHDGIVNTIDINYLKKSLLQKDDQEIIDNNFIIPTSTPTKFVTKTPTPTKKPTSIPTPTITNVNRSFTAEKYGSMNYWQYLPKGYNKALKWPLVIFLHGDGGWGTNKLNKLLTSGDLAGHLKSGNDYNAIAIEPQFDWPGEVESVFLKEKLIPYLVEKYNVDTDRISLMGSSSGAGRTIHMALKYPEFFSCLVPIALCERDYSWGKKLAKENIWAIHGKSDTTCSPEHSKRLVSYVNGAGGHAKLSLIDAGHGSSSPALNNIKVVNWMIKQVRGQPPKN